MNLAWVPVATSAFCSVGSIVVYAQPATASVGAHARLRHLNLHRVPPSSSVILDFSPNIHASRRLPSLEILEVREWTLARCGHHPFLDGRAARHRALNHPCLCGCDDWSLLHAWRTYFMPDARTSCLARVPFFFALEAHMADCSDGP